MTEKSSFGKDIGREDEPPMPVQDERLHAGLLRWR